MSAVTILNLKVLANASRMVKQVITTLDKKREVLGSPGHPQVCWFTRRPHGTVCRWCSQLQVGYHRGMWSEILRGIRHMATRPGETSRRSQGLSPSEVTCVELSCNELWRPVWSCACRGSSSEPRRPEPLLEAGHRPPLPHVHQSPRLPTGHRPQSLHELYKHSEPPLPEWWEPSQCLSPQAPATGHPRRQVFSK